MGYKIILPKLVKALLCFIMTPESQLLFFRQIKIHFNKCFTYLREIVNYKMNIIEDNLFLSKCTILFRNKNN